MMKVLGILLVALVAWAPAAIAVVAEGRWQRLENNPSCRVWNGNPKPNVTVTWSGACVSGKAQGRGTQVWRYLEDEEWKEAKYTGEMKDGKFHGRGVFEWASGDRYEGDWKDGKPTGRGVKVWADGSRYEGDWKDGKAHGRSTIWVRDARSFSGYWTSGCFKKGEFEAWIGTSREACGFD